MIRECFREQSIRAAKYTLVQMRLLRRALQIIRTPYWRLVLHDQLNFGPKVPVSITVVSEDNEHELLDINGVRLFWPKAYGHKGLRGLYREIFVPSDRNPHAYEVGDVRIQADDWVVDAGACEGFFTRYALQRGANVLMIEPVTELATALSRTFENELKSGRVRLLQAALTAESTTNLQLMVPEGEVYCARVEGQGPGGVDGYTIDQIVREGIVPTIDFLKMDIEGSELIAFEGASNVLQKIMPDLSIAVYHQYENARSLRDFILSRQPRYRVKWRGIFWRNDFGAPRPYMLHAKGKCG